MFSLIQLFFYLLINTKRNETIILYHSVILSFPIRVAKYLKKFKLILEVEEIYQYAQILPKHMKTSEYKIFYAADSYIFSTEMLNLKINHFKKPYVIIHGSYKIEKVRYSQKNDSKIHVVYAGTLDFKKGGAIVAVDVAKFLPENYHIHIIGFGSEDQLKSIKQAVKKTNEISTSTVSYDGLLRGEKYVEFLQKCHIGLSSQNPKAEYNDTSFPSKILSYMANGLRVVTVRIKAIELSSIGNAVNYYEEQNPEEIAEVIRNLSFNDSYDNKRIIKELDEKFCTNLLELLVI